MQARELPEARISDCTDNGPKFFLAPAMTNVVPRGLDLRVGRHRVYDATCITLSFLYADNRMALEAIQAAEGLVSEAGREARAVHDASPEADVAKKATEALREREAAVSEARLALSALQAEYDQSIAKGVYPDGVKVKLLEMEDRVRVLNGFAEPFRVALRAAKDRLTSALATRWRAAASRRGKDLDDRLSEVEEKFRELVEWATPEILEVAAAKLLLCGGIPPLPDRITPRPAPIDADIPPPPEDLEPGAMQPPVEEAEQTKFHLQKEAESTGSADESETDTRLAPEERRQRVKELRAEGKSTRQIAEELGCDQSTVVRDLARLDADASPVPARDSEPVA